MILCMNEKGSLCMLGSRTEKMAPLRCRWDDAISSLNDADIVFIFIIASM